MTNTEPGGRHDSVVVYESAITRERVEMEWPPSDLIAWEDLRESLGLPSWVDLSDRTVRQGVAGLWGQRRRHEEGVRAGRRKTHHGSARLLGGVAFRILCPSANSEGAFRRPLKDVDYLVGQKEANEFLENLLALSEWAGSSYLHFVLAEDRQYNALRGGKRFRVRAVSPSTQSVSVDSRVTDVFVGGLQFCHRLPVGDLELPSLTIPLPELILTKLQFIKRVPRIAVGSDREYRVLEVLGKNDVALGMEEKDILDVAAAFLDSEDVDALSSSVCGAVAASGDWGLWKTARMNLTNTSAVRFVLESRGVDAGAATQIIRRMSAAAELMTRSEPRRRVWDRRSVWFDEVEDN